MSHLPSPKNQSGIALVVALVVLLIITIIGLSSMNSSLMQTKVASGTKEYYSAFQAAETALSVAARNTPAFAAAITMPGPVTVPMDTASGLYPNSTLSATVTYQGEGTLPQNSSAGKFKPQYFIINGNVTREGSRAATSHSQGFTVLSPSS